MRLGRSSVRLLFGSLVYLVLVSSAGAQPNIRAVLDGASFGPLVSPGSLVSIFGTELAQSTDAASEVPLPTELDGVTVAVNGLEAPLYFVSPDQINAQIPFGISAEKVDLVVVTRQGQSPAYSVALLPTSPGIFTRSGDGKGTPVLLDPSFTLLETVAPGQRVILYAIGLGETDPQAATGMGGAGGEPLNRVADLPEVYIGGKQAQVEFAGLAPGFVAVYQLNVVDPEEFNSGRVFLISRGRRSNSTEITATLPDPVHGSGIVVSEVRPVGAFRRIQLFAIASVEVMVGQEASPLRIEAEDDLIGLISTQVRDGALQITSSGPYTTQTAVQVSLSVPALDRVELLGVGGFTVVGLSGGSFEAFLSGVGDVLASGSVDSVDVLLQGVGNVSLSNLAAKHVRAWLQGVGNVEVNASESLFARLHGIGDILYTGNPAQVDAEVKGVGEIRLGIDSGVTGRTISHSRVMEKLDEGGTSVLHKARGTPGLPATVVAEQPACNLARLKRPG